MEKPQRIVCVERQVIDALRMHLTPSIGVEVGYDYVTFDIDPATYSSGEQFKKDYAYISFLRKWKGFKDKRINPEWAAFSTWMKSEKSCFQTNRRLSTECSTGLFSVAPSIISDAQRKVAQILGDVQLEFISELCRFGNGATYDLRRGSTHAEKSCRPTITFDAIPWACRVLARDEYLASLVGPLDGLKVVKSNRMVMVPKTVKTHRPIAAEPTLNSYIQQGVGRYIRHRLKRFGVDLDDQTINQDLARFAQAFGLSTVDLSSASDTLCTNLVKLLVPPQWFELLDDLRCKFTDYKGKRFYLSKFSSMGNAYTFELESLIFYSLLSAACTAGVSSVYGDDLVVHNSDYRRVVETLTWAGFTVNASKSFSEGSRFYESCGKHYFDGEEVTPCFQKDVCSRPHDYVRLHNRLVRAGIRLGLRDEFEAAASIVRGEARSRFGRRCPDIGPLVEYDEYFIKEDYVWADRIADRLKLRSAVALPMTKVYVEGYEHIAYFGRKLRNPAFLSPDPKGHASDNVGSKLLVTEKYHWRSSTLTS
ncbi:TPA_asm: RNA-directed RNA polymerase [ssRNA phage Zoerhiza.1_29]|uniref:RNA-directed RNA polymerase n=2 Tax=Fiersviridae TaxID=2842319 RepID=A0A8S5L2S7_9VIRU|nr:RNA-directed RNA polymerase [ssRNA phage Zoerhiza.1_29]QDH89277.1 MAG: RNA-dependent RNA polymerase [Leviviridae sp.]DAD51450.1 TPA_asm: RNA-directed RNA polymerase [ssRNA phage Zoerhiza.1_29]